MEKLSMCRICLADNIRMYLVTNKNIQELYHKLTDTPFVSEDSRPLLACCFCYARLRQGYCLLRQCLAAEDMFTQMLSEDYERKPLKIEGNLEYFRTFAVTSVQHLNITPGYELEVDVIKEEIPFCDDADDFDLKEERRNDETTNLDNGYSVKNSPRLIDTDSEDDVPLMKLKAEVKDELELDKKRVVKKKKKLKQPDCKEIILSKAEQRENLLLRSKTSNYMNSPFKCSLCYKGFVNMQAYDNHRLKHNESSGPHVCDICHMHYHSYRLMRTHLVNAHARIFQCNKCGFNSHTTNQARIHEKWHNGHLYECLLCSQSFNKPTSYLSHMRKRHPTEHICNICGESFVGKHGLQMHKRKTHINGEKMVDPDDPDDPASKRFCSECNLQFYNAEAWKRHILCSVKHTLKNEESTNCSICPWKYVGTASLQTHMKEHVRALRRSRHPTSITHQTCFRCQQCGSNFIIRSKLQAHINRIHLGMKYNKNIVCEVCGKKCTSNATLIYHQRTHTGEKPYSCTTCSKHFVDSNQLRIHTRTHTGERPYVCAACGKRFSQKPALNRHYRVHTGAKPYSCQYCSRTFTQSNSVKLHVKTVHLKQRATSKRSDTATRTKQDNSEVTSVAYT